MCDMSFPAVPLKTVAVYGSRRQDGHIASIIAFLDSLMEAGVDVYIEKKLALLLNEEGYRLKVHGIRECTALPAHTDMVVSIGGDGTFLRASKWIGSLEIPIIGINTGHLGFLAENSIEDAPEIIDALKEGKYDRERRLVLEVSTPSIPEKEWPSALNEVAFLKADSASMIDVKVDVDGYFLANYRADGLLMATPTGSTAYNLSVGGPILVPTLQNIILSPIAPHTLTLRPVAVGADSELKAVVSSRKGEFRLSIDGSSCVIPCGTEVMVRKAPHSVITLRKKGENFASTLRNKLFWGV